MRPGSSVWLLLAAAWAGPALADGALPDELQVYLPADLPHRIILFNDFGLQESEDDGASWFFLCEPATGGGNVDMYYWGPTGTVIGRSRQLTRSTDEGCSWQAPSVCSSFVWDVAFDPARPGAALALGQLDGGGSGILPSVDDGETFGCPIFETPDTLQGVELSASSPGLVYASANAAADGGETGVPRVLVGVDGGASWPLAFDHPELASLLASGAAADGGPGAGLPEPLIRILAVDPRDSQTVFFRLTLPASGADFVAVTHDGGRSLQVLFAAPAPLSAFLDASDGTLYAGTRGQGLWSAAPVTDGGLPAFRSVNPIPVRCLGERGGLLYACGDDFAQHMALGVSRDQGQSFTSIATFSQLQGLVACPNASQVVESCGPTWCALAAPGMFGVDAGYPCDAGTTSGAPVSSGGCGCASGTDAAAALAGLAGLLALRARNRRRAAS